VNGREDAARSLYLGLRVVGLEVWVEENLERGPLDCGIEFAGMHKVPGGQVENVRERIKHNEEGLVRVLLDHRDPDIKAVRAEGNNRY